ncbi:hypothetical protein B0T10DRAFT_261693 [Thelonectria olida]|uniref:Uncharacterized protein n=1 Tax=Thelonectria olida TaxID=1576542 RepID=A0A9P8VT09_9HYPO|nr:hypothetical protein B0T10DRAFT_261693 [Thelonectria olida]
MDNAAAALLASSASARAVRPTLNAILARPASLGCAHPAPWTFSVVPGRFVFPELVKLPARPALSAAADRCVRMEGVRPVCSIQTAVPARHVSLDLAVRAPTAFNATSAMSAMAACATLRACPTRPALPARFVKPVSALTVLKTLSVPLVKSASLENAKGALLMASVRPPDKSASVAAARLDAPRVSAAAPVKSVNRTIVWHARPLPNAQRVKLVCLEHAALARIARSARAATSAAVDSAFLLVRRAPRALSDKSVSRACVSLAPATRTAATARSAPLGYALPIFSRLSVATAASFARAASAILAARPTPSAAVVEFASLDFAWHAEATRTAATAKRVSSDLAALVRPIYSATLASASIARTEPAGRLARQTLSAALAKSVPLAVAALALRILNVTLAWLVSVVPAPRVRPARTAPPVKSAATGSVSRAALLMRNASAASSATPVRVSASPALRTANAMLARPAILPPASADCARWAAHVCPRRAATVLLVFVRRRATSSILVATHAATAESAPCWDSVSVARALLSAAQVRFVFLGSALRVPSMLNAQLATSVVAEHVSRLAQPIRTAQLARCANRELAHRVRLRPSALLDKSASPVLAPPAHPTRNVPLPRFAAVAFASQLARATRTVTTARYALRVTALLARPVLSAALGKSALLGLAAPVPPTPSVQQVKSATVVFALPDVRPIRTA